MRIQSRSTLTHPLADVVAWHQRRGALQRLCPPGLGSLEDPRDGGIEEGKRVTSRMGPPVLGDRVRPAWVLRHGGIRETPTGFRFEDTQVSGPFRLWRHQHEMAATEDGTGTVLTETIDLELPSVASVGDRIAADQVRRMLDFRSEQLQADLDLHARFADSPRLTVAVAGASGMIGTQLVALLETGGHTVRRLVRGGTTDPSPAGDIGWDPESGRLDPADLADVDAVVNLAGRSIATLFTAKAKREILTSRTRTSGLLARTLAQVAAGSPTGPAGMTRSLVQASAIGYYGSQRPDELLVEDSAPGRDVLAEVCRAWEGALEPASAAGVRTVALRTGIVLSDGGGALLPQLPLFAAGVGGRLTAPDAVVSWITLDDAVRTYLHALLTPDLSGPVNMVAPSPVTSQQFADTLGRVMKRPAKVPVPRFGPELLLGREAAKEMVAADQDVSDEKLRGSGFAAADPDLRGALRHVLRR